MRLGTKSLLVGCHQFMLHPLFVLVAWWRLYGWAPWRVIVAIVIHDWGYWGCETMDGPDGRDHPKWAAHWCLRRRDVLKVKVAKDPWGDVALECQHHSRYLARETGSEPSRLCWADKIGTAMYPTWLWVLVATLSGEVHEYLGVTGAEFEAIDPELARGSSRWQFFRSYKAKWRTWLKARVA